MKYICDGCDATFDEDLHRAAAAQLDGGLYCPNCAPGQAPDEIDLITPPDPGPGVLGKVLDLCTYRKRHQPPTDAELALEVMAGKLDALERKLDDLLEIERRIDALLDETRGGAS